MIYIITAMYAEAHPFITRFQLKKDISHTRFQVFLDREADLCLVISGTGSIPAAVAASTICTEYHAGQGDFLLNVGVCGQIRNEDIRNEDVHGEDIHNEDINSENIQRARSACQTGKVFLCNKIKEQVTGRTFYPDILYRHKFAEAQIITGAKPYEKAAPATACSTGIKDNRYAKPHERAAVIEAERIEAERIETERIETEDTDFCLYDMEAAAIYQAGAYFFGPHQMNFIKIISDDGNTENITSEQIERLIDNSVEPIADYMSTLRTAAEDAAEKQPEAILPVGFQNRQNKLLWKEKDTAQKELEQLCLDLHCSKVMADTVRQYLCYCALADVDYASVLEDMYRTGKLPCKDKREGKKCLEELKKRLL